MTHKKKEPDIDPFLFHFFGVTHPALRILPEKNKRACQIIAGKPHKTLNTFRSKNKLSRNSPA